jgi:hypothetical protein
MATESEVLARLTPEVQAFLAERRFAVVASIRADGLPHQTVMWYELRGDVSSSTRGRCAPARSICTAIRACPSASRTVTATSHSAGRANCSRPTRRPR